VFNACDLKPYFSDPHNSHETFVRNPDDSTNNPISSVSPDCLTPTTLNPNQFDSVPITDDASLPSTPQLSVPPSRSPPLIEPLPVHRTVRKSYVSGPPISSRTRSHSAPIASRLRSTYRPPDYHTRISPQPTAISSHPTVAPSTPPIPTPTPMDVDSFDNYDESSDMDFSYLSHSQSADRNDVKLDPRIYRQAKKFLNFKPSVDLFANAAHHQVPLYYSKTHDPAAIGMNAFSVDWNTFTHPYINPPWPDITRCLRKIVTDQVKVLMVTPLWMHAPWFPLWKLLRVKSIEFDEPIYLRPDGTLWPKPKWKTVIALLDGRRVTA